MNGILIVDKDKDMTSRAVVDQLCKKFNTKKIGHTGTLDPLATGVLVITIGKYTKLTEVLTSLQKEYYATMQLGIMTDTLDITGKILKEEPVNISKEAIQTSFNQFPKEYDQTVPLYSAVKIKGKKLYEYARSNQEIDLPTRAVKISELELLEVNNNLVTFRCIVSKGTYIRSLIRDLGASLNTSATMISLRRTKQGKFSLQDSYKLEDIMADHYELKEINDILDVDIIDMDSNLAKKISNGGKYQDSNDHDFILFRYNNEDVALYKKDETFYKMYLHLQ